MRVAIWILLLAASAFRTAGAATVVVDVNGGAGSDYLTIGEGLLAAASHDTVLVMPGTYSGAQNRDMDPLGREVVIRASGGADSTIIDCGGAGRAFDIHSGEGSSLVIDGFTITGGFAVGPGGGVSVQSSSPTIRNCVFLECESEDFGGGVYLESSSTVMRDVEFRANSADNGGGVATEGSTADIADCLFWGNAAVSGGAVYSADDDESTFEEVACLHNEASDWGGAVCVVWGSTPSITNSLFFENGTTGSGGGAISCHEEGTSATITGNTFSENGGARSDGAVFFGPDTQGILYQNIIAFSTSGGVQADGSAFVTSYHNCVFANAGGDSLPSNHYDNMFGSDPLFCDPPGLDFSLASNSHCLAVNNSWDLLIGTYDEGCVESPVTPASWGAIKAMYR